jgi:hypothetical protein
VARRERTHHLIELGGLVHKAGLVELTGDDRATLLGGFLLLADMLAGVESLAALALFNRRGRRAFAATEPDAGTNPDTRTKDT